MSGRLTFFTAGAGGLSHVDEGLAGRPASA
jgi:hypothetical protein